MNRSLWTVCIGAALGTLALPSGADPLLDFGVVSPPAPSQRAIVEPVVSWVVNPDPQAYCNKVTPRDGVAMWQEACVVWPRATSRCTVVTRASTSHSQLGHLFVHCLQGR